MLSRRPQLAGYLVGVLVAAVTTAACFLVADPKLQIDYFLFDPRIRHFNTIKPHEKIVHVDIDDNAVLEVGRWPWRRRQVAELISVINELGASHIFVDLLFSEKEELYPDSEAFYRDADIDPNRETLVDAATPRIVRGDEELAAAVRNAGNVIMAVDFSIRSPDDPPRLDERLATLASSAARPPTDEQLLSAANLADSPANRDRLRDVWNKKIVVDALRENFTLDTTALTKAAGLDALAVERVLARAKREAAAELVERVFAANHMATLADVRKAAYGDSAARLGDDDDDLRNAYRRQQSLIDVQASLIAAPGLDRATLYSAYETIPLLHPIGAGAAGIAAVNFAADDDGIVRRVPPLIRYNDRLIPHMGVAAAAKILDFDLPAATRPSAQTLRIPRNNGSTIDIPLDARGNMVIPWTGTATRWRRGEDFRHITAAKLIEIVEARRTIEENRIRLLHHWAEVVASVSNPIKETNTATGEVTEVQADRAYLHRVNTAVSQERELDALRLSGKIDSDEAAALRQSIESLKAKIKLEEQNAAGMLQMLAEQLKTITDEEINADEALKADIERFKVGYAIYTESIPKLNAANEKIESHVEKLIARLRSEIEGKYVFVGFAATAQGDIVPTPIDPTTNGVMCHANVLNAFLQNRFITLAPPWIEAVLCLLAGSVAGLWTAVRTPRFALIATAALIASICAIGFLVLFRQFDIWYVVAPYILVVSFCWAAVTLFRQLTAERDKRLFRAQLSQYTSPAIAARIAESPEAAEAFKKVQTRDVTCFFSDLAGFTTISEREDAEQVQHVLNIYLRRMSEVIWRHHGLLNKFMGDGIMAFFNASVDPLDDHPRAACETALDTMAALEELKREMSQDSGAAIFAQLQMRIGMAAGLVKNGDMGSELKADYTVIGDVVNLSARLEPANKVFGTQLLISGPLYDRVREHYDARYLADLQVKGKNKTVPVYELIGRKGTMTDEQKTYVERFEQGVALYKQRKWDECIVHFTRMLARRPDDPGAGRYIDACQEMKVFPPEGDWNGALELKEK